MPYAISVSPTGMDARQGHRARPALNNGHGINVVLIEPCNDLGHIGLSVTETNRKDSKHRFSMGPFAFPVFTHDQALSALHLAKHMMISWVDAFFVSGHTFTTGG